MIVQTLVPDAPAIVARRLARQRDGFLDGELERRAALRYPPFSTLIRVVCSSRRGGRGAATPPASLHARLPGALGPAPLFRLRGKERSQVVVKADDRHAAVAAVGAAVDALARDRAHRGVALSVDVDPQ